MSSSTVTEIGLTPAQERFLRSPALFRSFVGGRGAGKSFVGALDLLLRTQPGGLYLVAAPTYPMLRDASLRTFRGVAEALGVSVNLRRGDMTAELGSGAEVLFRSADNPDRLRGPNLSGAWLDEASIMAREAYDIVLAALRQDGRQGWMTATFTPAGLAHWTYEKFGARDVPDTELVRSRTDENPFLPPEFAETIARQYDDGYAAQELGGEFVDLIGAEWPASYFRKEIWFDEWLPDSEYPVTVVGFDPNRGREVKAGDYAALVVARLDKTLTIWADAVMANTGDVHQHVGRGVALAREYRGSSMVVETNVGQELLVAEIERQQRQSGVMFPVMGYENRVPKTDRIRMRLGPYLARGRIRLRATKGGKLLGAQLQQFPNGEHDDGPDALELSVRRLEEIVNGSGVKKR